MKKIIPQDTECPIKRTLDIIGGKWKLRLISQIGNERMIGELKKLHQT